MDTNIQHLHDETKILPLTQHLKLHASQLRQKAQLPDHPLHELTQNQNNPRHKQQTIFDNDNNYTTNLDTPPDTTTKETIKLNMKTIHSQITNHYLENRNHNKIIDDIPPPINDSEQRLPKNI